MGEFVGNVRVSIRDQNLDAQLDVLPADGCARIFAATASGALRDRPEPAAASALLVSSQTTTAADRRSVSDARPCPGISRPRRAREWRDQWPAAAMRGDGGGCW